MRPTATPTIEVHSSLADAARSAAATIVQATRDAVARDGRFTIALAGGETPRALYERLAADAGTDMPWDCCDFLFGDERCVPPHNPQSNFRLAWSTLLSLVPVVEARVHRIFGELGPAPAAVDYDTRLRQIFSRDERTPSFDVALLGVGTDGHTASLFPGDHALDERERWAVPAFAPVGVKVHERVTLTLPMLNRARVVLFLCAGAEKRSVLTRILSHAAPELPAAQVRGVERTIWILDREAAP